VFCQEKRKFLRFTQMEKFNTKLSADFGQDIQSRGKIFHFLRSRTLTLRFVRVRGSLWMPLLGAPQEVAEERRPGVPPGNPLVSHRFTTNGGAVRSASLLPLRGIYQTPQRGLLLAKTFDVSVCLKFVRTRARRVARRSRGGLYARQKEKALKYGLPSHTPT
jgi:hypothetical protein